MIVIIAYCGSDCWAQDASAPTPLPAVRAALDVVDLQPGEILYDLGCGDGGVMLVAGQEYGAGCVGVEYDTAIYYRAKANLEQHDTGPWRLIRGDATEYKLSRADVVFVFLYQDVLEQIHWETLKPGARVISYAHDIPGLKTTPYRCRIDGTEHLYFIHKASK